MHPRSPSWGWHGQNPYPAVWPPTVTTALTDLKGGFQRLPSGGERTRRRRLRPASPLNPAFYVDATAGGDYRLIEGLPTNPGVCLWLTTQTKYLRL